MTSESNGHGSKVALRSQRAAVCTARRIRQNVLPNVEIICLLHESFGGGFLPEPDSADDWQSRFEQLAAEVSAERREVIGATFQKLRQLARQCWEE